MTASLVPQRRVEPIWPWLVAMVVIAAALRLPTMGRESLWNDEAISYLAAKLPVDQILNNTIRSAHPPLYYLLLHGWLKVVPRTDGAARLLGAVWDLLLVPALYWLTVELYGDRRRGLFAALLVALSPFHTLYSHELRMYTQLMLLVTVGTAAYVRARRSSGWGWWLGLGGAYLAALYTHLFAFLSLAAIGLHALLHHRNRKAMYRTIALGVALAILFSPWVYVVWCDGQREVGSLGPLYRGEALSADKALRTTAFLAFGQSHSAAYSGVAFFAILSLAVVLPLEARKQRYEGGSTGTELPVLMVLCGVAAPVAACWIRPFLLPDRVMAATSPFLLALFAWGLYRHSSPLPYIAYGVAGVMAVGCVLYLTGSRIKPPYREAMGLIAQERMAGDVVLHTCDRSYLPALRYVDWPNHALLGGDPSPRKPRTTFEAAGGDVWSLPEALAAGRRLWLVVALEDSVDWQIAQVERVSRQRVLLASYDVEGIRILLYDLAGGSGRL